MSRFLERFGFWTVLDGLRSSYLAVIVGAIFLLDLVIPDPIPFSDEILLGVATILVARWQGRKKQDRDRDQPPSPDKPPAKDVTSRAERRS